MTRQRRGLARYAGVFGSSAAVLAGMIVLATAGIFGGDTAQASHTAFTTALPIPPVLVHHVIAQASLLVGESATMASEAAVLGTPAVFCSPVGRGYTDEEEKRFGLVWNVKKEEDALRAVDQILAIGPDAASLRREFQRRRSHLIRESVDVTGWILDHMGAGTSGAACGLGELQPAFAASEESEFAPASRAGISPA